MFSKLKIEEERKSAMGKIVVSLTKKIIDYFKAVIADELKEMNVYYRQFD